MQVQRKYIYKKKSLKIAPSFNYLLNKETLSIKHRHINKTQTWAHKRRDSGCIQDKYATKKNVSKK